MAVTAATPITGAQVLLNDRLGTNYTAAVLIPFIQKAYRELQIKMLRAGLSVAKEVSDSITVSAGTVRLADGAGLPSGFLYPITLFERGSSSEDWAEMHELPWEPETEQTSTLQGKYAWREEEIKFIGSTTTRYVKIRYAKGLTEITATSTPLQINDCDVYLAARGAAIAAFTMGNPSRATGLDLDAEKAWIDLKGTSVKRRQSMPVRRRTNRYRR